LFPTQEIGSLAKPSWRIKAYKGEPLSREDWNEAKRWGTKLEIEDLSGFLRLLRDKDSPERRKATLEYSAKYAIRFFEKAGLDVIFDGEQWRAEMYEHLVKNVYGFQFLGYVKCFDYRYFNKATCIRKLKHVRHLYLDEFLFTAENTKKEIKIPIIGPYTTVDWSFNEYYEKALNKKTGDLRHKHFEARREFLFDLIKTVMRPEIRKLVDSGAKWIQIDEPAATTHKTDEEMALFVNGFNEITKGFNCKFSLHNCYSDYKTLAKYACELRNCSQLALEFANRDFGKTRVENGKRGYDDIKMFEEHGFRGNYGVGVIDVHRDFIEPPKLVVDRILYVAKLVKNPSRICVSTDCGLRTRTWETSFGKLRNMVLGAQQARRVFEG